MKKRKKSDDYKQQQLITESTIDRLTNLIVVAKKQLKECLDFAHKQEAAITEAKNEVDAVSNDFFKLCERSLFDEEKPGKLSNQDEVDFSDSEVISFLEDRYGKDIAIELAEEFKGSTIYFPKSFITKQKHAQIRKEYREGKSYKELAMKYSYTESHIRFIIHKKKPRKVAEPSA